MACCHAHLLSPTQTHQTTKLWIHMCTVMIHLDIYLRTRHCQAVSNDLQKIILTGDLLYSLHSYYIREINLHLLAR